MVIVIECVIMGVEVVWMEGKGLGGRVVVVVVVVVDRNYQLGMGLFNDGLYYDGIFLVYDVIFVGDRGLFDYYYYYVGGVLGYIEEEMVWL